MDERLRLQFTNSELRTASEVIHTFLPFLSADMCPHCSTDLSHRFRSLFSESFTQAPHIYRSPPQRKRKYEDEPNYIDDFSKDDEREHARFMNVERIKYLVGLERVHGKPVNILHGIELHTRVFNASEQRNIVRHIKELQERGRRGKLRERTYSAPRKWMRGKGRETIQFGCCYNYATDKKGNPPGILRDEVVDPIPPLFKSIIKRLIEWRVLPPSCVPDSCIVNIYEEGDCIPPHIDNHDFLRPFCTVSFLSECNVVFGTELKVVGPGEFTGAYKVRLPVGSVLVIKGNGADVAKHCVPAVRSKRISITFRRMAEAKRPAGYKDDPDLQGLRPLGYTHGSSGNPSPLGSDDDDLEKPRNLSKKQQLAPLKGSGNRMR